MLSSGAAGSLANGSLDTLRESIRNNPANVERYRVALECAQTRIPFDEAARIVAAAPVPATCTVYPKNALTNLVRKGALEQTAMVDGEPYAGTCEALCDDESVPEGAEISYYLHITEVGRVLLAELDPAARASALLSSKPERLQGFLVVLEALASSDGGCSRREVEDALKAHPQTLSIDSRTGLSGVSPAFYTTSLEDAGALSWADGLWKITEAGVAALAEWKGRVTERGEEGGGE